MTNTDVQRFNDIRACVFDAYGTLFDVHSAVGRFQSDIQDLGADASALSGTWRVKQLEYSWLRSLMGRYCDFWQVTQDALDYAFDTHGVTSPDLNKALMQAYLSLDAFEEVTDVLTRLKKHNVKLAVLSNGSPAMLASAVERAGLTDLLDVSLSVEDVGIFKPDPRVYQLAVTQLNVSADQISFQSSNAWDVAGASTFGFSVVWINRYGQKPERLPDGPHAELSTLSSLPEIVTPG